MSDRAALLDVLRREAVRHGEFTLASGKRSNVYVDVRLASLRSDAAPLIGRLLLDEMDRRGFAPRAVGGMATGAIPLVAAVVTAAAARSRTLIGFYVRKESREHGRERLVEGVERPSGEAVVLEDTASTGGSLLRAVRAAQAAGFAVSFALALVDRDMGAEAALQAEGVPFGALFRLRELTG